MASRTGELLVTLKKATGLQKQQLIGRQDPYCLLRLGASKPVRSPTHVDGAQEPVWNYTVRMHTEGQPVLTIEIMNENKLKQDKLIGSVEVSLDAAYDHGVLEGAFPVYSKQGNQHGCLILELQYTTATIYPRQYMEDAHPSHELPSRAAYMSNGVYLAGAAAVLGGGNSRLGAALSSSLHLPGYSPSGGPSVSNPHHPHVSPDWHASWQTSHADGANLSSSPGGTAGPAEQDSQLALAPARQAGALVPFAGQKVAPGTSLVYTIKESKASRKNRLNKTKPGVSGDGTYYGADISAPGRGARSVEDTWHARRQPALPFLTAANVASGGHHVGSHGCTAGSELREDRGPSVRQRGATWPAAQPPEDLPSSYWANNHPHSLVAGDALRPRLPSQPPNYHHHPQQQEQEQLVHTYPPRPPLELSFQRMSISEQRNDSSLPYSFPQHQHHQHHPAPAPALAPAPAPQPQIQPQPQAQPKSQSYHQPWESPQERALWGGYYPSPLADTASSAPSPIPVSPPPPPPPFFLPLHGPSGVAPPSAYVPGNGASFSSGTMYQLSHLPPTSGDLDGGVDACSWQRSVGTQQSSFLS